jgi:hypothetical protein
MKIVEKVTIAELLTMSERMSEPLVKGVVDVVRRLLVIDAGLHSDEEYFLLEQGSKQADLWGVNLWPEFYGTDEFVEFDSITNTVSYLKRLIRARIFFVWPCYKT